MNFSECKAILKYTFFFPIWDPFISGAWAAASEEGQLRRYLACVYMKLLLKQNTNMNGVQRLISVLDDSILVLGIENETWL